jgi:hypothetical protein
MSTRHFSSLVVRAAVAAACVIGSAACGSDMLRTGRSPSYLVVEKVEGIDTAGVAAADLRSDVRDDSGTVLNDNARVTIRVEAKNPTVASTAINAVTLTRYHVDYRRTDGRNTPGVDVPYSFDGALSVTIDPGSSGQAVFEVVRHQAKLEPPLKNLDGLSSTGERLVTGLGFLSTIAEITLYGHDGNGNEVSVRAQLDVHFGDFATTK